MDIKGCLCKTLALCLLALSGCTHSEEPPYVSSPIPESTSSSVSSKASESSSSSVSSKESSESSSETSSSEIPPASSESQEPPQVEDVPPPEPLEFEGLDFTAMTEEELKEALKKVLDAAADFCNYGLAAGYERMNPNVKVGEPVKINNDTWWPIYGFPYKTLDDLKQAMLTVFTTDVVEDRLFLIFPYVTDRGYQGGRFFEYEGKIYTRGDGYTLAREWDVDHMEIQSIAPDELTVEMPVVFNTYYKPVTGTETLTFHYDGLHILVGQDYFSP